MGKGTKGLTAKPSYHTMGGEYLFRGARFCSLGDGTTEKLRNFVGEHRVKRLDMTTGVFGLSRL